MRRLLSQLSRDTRFLLCLEDAIGYRVLWPADGGGITVADHRGQWVRMPEDTEVIALW